jgi:hypothetical protein
LLALLNYHFNCQFDQIFVKRSGRVEYKGNHGAEGWKTVGKLKGKQTDEMGIWVFLRATIMPMGMIRK